MPVRPRSVAVASLALSVALATGATACSSDSSSSASTTTAAASSSTTGSSSSTAGTVSANDASQAEIAAALDAAGVANADRWADEVVEYRPYDDASEGFPRLREELAKYNPADGVIDSIIAVLR